MKTLTRILTTRVYNLDLDNLPLDRLSEQQSKRRRALGKGGKSQDGEGRRGPGSGAAETASGTVRTHRIANDVEGSSKLIQGMLVCDSIYSLSRPTGDINIWKLK